MNYEQFATYLRGILEFNKSLTEEQVTLLKTELSKVGNQVPYTLKPKEIHQPITDTSFSNTLQCGNGTKLLWQIPTINLAPGLPPYSYILSENGPLPVTIRRN